MPEASTTLADAKALFETLDALVEALRHVDHAGPKGRLTDLGEALDEAEVLLQALDGDYGYA